ncbi:hypothetical protein PFDG_04364 [Plasmodium falciparum Dd2]|uniref:Uncharacterized protein n=1 Tax=Plasmodium falciparum (isolate Dd2) TaxID=57267 RepID=A0A0L7M5T2_PLAF4|nr:hypothetical protein PFDG_04364 [Plasmodium falciparum Dd2]
MNINMRELDEYSCVKKLYIKKCENNDIQKENDINKKNKKKHKKKKKQSIISSIINDDETYRNDNNYNNYYNIIDNLNYNIHEEKNNNNNNNVNTENSLLPYTNDGKINNTNNLNNFGPIIKKSDDNILSSDVLKHIKTLDIHKKIKKPKWHFPYKLYRVILGHSGWVNCVDVDISNEWFATGSNDRLIKIWDLASCKLKLTLTGHINSIRI